MRSIRNENWRSPSAQPVGKKVTDYLIDLLPDTRLIVEVRSSQPVVLSLVDDVGELLFLEQGQVVSFQQRVTGFAGLNIAATAPFRYDIRQSVFAEAIDPVPVVIVDEFPQELQEREVIRQELHRLLSRSGILQEAEISVDDLFDEAEGGMEFDDDLDGFEDTPYMEQDGLDPNEDTGPIDRRGDGPPDPEEQTLSPSSKAPAEPAASSED